MSWAFAAHRGRGHRSDICRGGLGAVGPMRCPSLGCHKGPSDFAGP
jgi:hypothetical protein